MEPPRNGDDWSVWGKHVLAELSRLNDWLQSIERRLWSVMVMVILLLLGFVLSLLKG